MGTCTQEKYNKYLSILRNRQVRSIARGMPWLPPHDIVLIWPKQDVANLQAKLDETQNTVLEVRSEVEEERKRRCDLEQEMEETKTHLASSRDNEVGLRLDIEQHEEKHFNFPRTFSRKCSKHCINKLKILYKPTRIMRIRALLLGTSRSNGLSARFMSPYHTQNMKGSTRSTCCLVTRKSQESKQCLSLAL